MPDPVGVAVQRSSPRLRDAMCVSLALARETRMNAYPGVLVEVGRVDHDVGSVYRGELCDAHA